MTEARAVVIERPGELRVVPREPDPPGPGEALVRVAWAGICGSDRDLLDGDRPAPYVRYPVTPGHEWSGTVADVGAGIERGLVGRPVVGEGFRSCLRCTACRRGDTNLCEAEYDETGFTRPGAWADHLTLPARLLHVLPDGADLRAAALLEPAACVAAACLKANVLPGERAAVVGAGTLGLLATQLLAAVHPAELVVVHTRTERAQLAERCGATSLVTVDEAPALAGRFDAVVETAGASGAARTATRLARRGGRVVLIGITPAEADPPSPTDLVLAALTVHTVFGAPARAWSHAVRAFASGALHPADLVTHEFPLEEVAEAYRVLEHERGKTVKVLLHP